MLETLKNKAKEYHKDKKKYNSSMVDAYFMEGYCAFLIVGAVAFTAHVQINDIDLPSPFAHTNNSSSQDATNYLLRSKSNISSMRAQPTVRSSYSSKR